MGSLAIQLPIANNAADAMNVHPLDELNDAAFVVEVLRSGHTEEQLEEDLITKATALGISIPRPPSPAEKNDCSGADSDATLSPSHVRNSSSGSGETAVAAIKSNQSSRSNTSAEAQGPTYAIPSPRARSRSLNFSTYDKYLSQVEPNLCQPKFLKHLPAATDSAPSIFSDRTRRSYISIKNGLKAKVRWRRQPCMSSITLSCVCCRDDFNQHNDLLHLPCGHTYCGNCLRIMINQSTTDESKMPPRCCTQPIPGTIIRPLLTRDEQQTFLKAVQQFSTPWESRIFCPNPNCHEFIPPRNRIDPKHPFDVVCRECRTRVCVMCKRGAHSLGQDCPSDVELDQVLRMGEKSGWRRCYKCRTLVELTQGCTHMTCRCKAQFCYICGAIWDQDVGCPNFCNGEEELERRRMEEAAREAELEAEKAAQEAAAAKAEVERQEAEKRTQASEEFMKLEGEQEEEMMRFRTYERKSKWIMWKRHAERKLVLNEKYSDLIEKMKERHAKTEQHLEERQIAAEMELRVSLEQAEKSVRIRVKHMEAYCKALGRSSMSGDSNMPPRVVTERHLRELGQQHNVLEGMARLHQARINVLRDRQAKRMEELLERQEKELEKLEEKRDEDVEDMASEFANEEDALTKVFEERKARLVRRWELAIEILRAEMEKEKGVKYGPMPTPTWRAESPISIEELALADGALAVVQEEEEKEGDE
ncbi:putative E3 ubiquitin-protein ligase ARI10 [Cytospora mali]|uniref:RBR-type E3 ubiquitin transferase n=1 Tax=Cytospora mali TaxID=578113 RepID=A0A194WAK9_CYTMA|nr:putative E3 ubiquitin-protein ligase ARI10 [Valsa mali]